MKKRTFNSFMDYWKKTQGLDQFQRKILFDSLPMQQQNQLISQFKDQKWQELVVRQLLDDAIEKIKQLNGLDFFGIKKKVLTGKSVCIPSIDWDVIVQSINQITSEQKYIKYIFDGISVQKQQDVVFVCKTIRQ